MSIISQFVPKGLGNYKLFSSSANIFYISDIRPLLQQQLSSFCESHVSWLVKWQIACGNRFLSFRVVDQFTLLPPY